MINGNGQLPFRAVVARQQPYHFASSSLLTSLIGATQQWLLLIGDWARIWIRVAPLLECRAATVAGKLHVVCRSNRSQSHSLQSSHTFERNEARLLPIHAAVVPHTIRVRGALVAARRGVEATAAKYYSTSSSRFLTPRGARFADSRSFIVLFRLLALFDCWAARLFVLYIVRVRRGVAASWLLCSLLLCPALQQTSTQESAGSLASDLFLLQCYCRALYY